MVVGQSDLGLPSLTDVKEFVDDMPGVDDIFKSVLFGMGAVAVGAFAVTAISFVVPFVLRGTAGTIVHGGKAVGETSRLPFRIGGWMKKIKKDVNPE